MDHQRSQVRRKSNRDNVLVSVVGDRVIGKGTESALDLVCALDRLCQQIVTEDHIQLVVLNVEMKKLSRLAPIYLRSKRPARYFVEIRRRKRHRLGKVDHDTVCLNAPM